MVRRTFGNLLGQFNGLLHFVITRFNRALHISVRVAAAMTSSACHRTIPIGTDLRLLAEIELLVKKLDKAKLHGNVGIGSFLVSLVTIHPQNESSIPPPFR